MIKTIKESIPAILKAPFKSAHFSNSPIYFSYLVNRSTVLEKMARWIEKKSNQRTKILEIACGPGYYSDFFANRLKFLSYTAIDKNPQVVALADAKRPTNRKVVFEVGDAFKLKYSRDSFDIVLVVDFLHHAGSDWKKIIDQIQRVLKPKGCLLIKDYSIETFTYPGLGTLMQYATNHDYTHMYDQIELLTYLRKNGFKLVKTNDSRWNLTICAQKIKG